MKIAFIGSGRMAGALVQGILKASITRPGDVILTSASQESARKMAAQLGVSSAAANADAASGADIVFLCVKPGHAETALRQCGDSLKKKLLISLASGISLSVLSAWGPKGCRIIRAMPNVAALVGRGVTAISPADGVTPEDLAIVEKLFAAVGWVHEVPEGLIDGITGLSGSGTAFVQLFIEALSDGGVAAGVPRDLALKLAIQTVIGGAILADESGQHPAVLREMVTSPGGTTIAGLSVLESRGVRGAILQAVKTAGDRARELGAK